MNGNPLLPQNVAPDPAVQQEEPAHIVHLVSNSPPNEVVGIGGFLAAFNSDTVKAEVEQFRYVIQRKARRGLGGKFSRGLTTEVTENVEINPNQDLFGLRRWLGYVRNDPSNVLLVNVTKVKEDSIAAPLIFSEILRTGRPILVTGLDPSSKDQLLSPVDLDFREIPAPVAQNFSLKLMLLARVQRRKGFASSMRALMDLDFIPKPVHDKVLQVATGGDTTALSEPETLNLALLADLATRYEAVLNHFRSAMQNSTLQVPQLISMFELLMADINLETGIELYKEFLQEAIETGAEITNKGQLFAHAFRFLGQREDARDRTARLMAFNRTLMNAFLKRRSQVDPLLWRRCHFLGRAHPAEQSLLQSLVPYQRRLHKWIKEGTESAGEEVHNETGQRILDLARLANRHPETLKEESDYVRLRLANLLLGHFRTEQFNTQRFINSGKPVDSLEEEAHTFLENFRKTPITRTDLQRIRSNLAAVLNPDEVASQMIRKSVLDVMVRHARQREQTLREIYILNAVKSLVKFPFHIGTKGLSSIERKCSLDLIPSRLGLEFHAHPVSEVSIALFAEDETPDLGGIKNDALTLCRAYAELVELRVETIVKSTLDHKINYYIKTFGENFFGVLYERVVRRNDIPMSQDQLARILRTRNLLGNLDTKGWKAEGGDVFTDPLLTVGMARPEGKKVIEIPKSLSDFNVEYTDSYAQFRVLLLELKASAEEDAREENPDRIIWTLYRQGIYNMFREEGKEAFRKTPYYRSLQDLIAKISSENYSVFHRESTTEGVKIYIPRKYAHLLVIGERFSFLDADHVVKYELIASPVEKLEQLDDLSRVFIENLEQQFLSENKEPWVTQLESLIKEIERCNQIWSRYSRNLALALLDRVISETVIKQLQPDRVGPENLYYVPDGPKLCLGKAVVGQEAAPFSKVLQRPELIGNVSKNPDTSSTTIDDFMIEVHKIERVVEELRTYQGVTEDVLDILQSLSHERAEMGGAMEYEKLLKTFARVLAKPVRDVTEHDVQMLHTLAKKTKEVLNRLYTSPSSARQKITNRLQSQLEARRSDSHLFKLNFTDRFLLAKEQVAVRQMVQKGGERVAMRKKIEVEVDPSHQTLPMRLREVIRLQETINKKKYLVLSPEGQKKKQTDYALEIIDTLQTMRGSGIHLFVDYSMLEESQVHRLATRVKPTNFFDMNELKPLPLPGMKVTGGVNPLTGLPVAPQAAEAPPAAPPPAAEPVVPAEEPNEVVFRSSKDPAISYRHVRDKNAYFYENAGVSTPASVFPVKLGKKARSVILMVKQPGGRPLFHGIFGNEILHPLEQQPQPPTICTFQFFDQTVRIVNEGGKPVVRIQEEESSFLKELKSI